MGRASTAKRERRRHTARTASIEVVCPGMLDVLSVGKGDVTITVGGDEAEVAEGRRIIEQMIRAGYGIFVESDKGLRRVKRFNPNRMTYVVSEPVEADALPPASTRPALPAAPAKAPAKRTRDVDVPVAGSRAKAIGRTAGG